MSQAKSIKYIWDFEKGGRRILSESEIQNLPGHEHKNNFSGHEIKHEIKNENEKNNCCPFCGTSGLIHQGGCVQCLNCGWSKCG